jgi:hypothetical protein
VALTVETGAIVSGADSYVSAANALTYHAAFGNAAWAASTDAAREIALRRAARLLDSSYRWRGSIYSEAQEMRWPRSGVLDRDGREIASTFIPKPLADAQCELALLMLSGELVGGASGSVQTATGKVQRVKAGSVEVEFAAGLAPALPTPASNVLPDGAGELLDRILTGLFTPASNHRVPLGKS